MSVVIFSIIAVISGLLAIKFLLAKNVTKNQDEE